MKGILSYGRYIKNQNISVKLNGKIIGRIKPVGNLWAYFPTRQKTLGGIGGTFSTPLAVKNILEQKLTSHEVVK